MKTTTQKEARIFLTDYASYNNGTQFEFGHWIDLNDFSSSEELNEYIKNHFSEADKKSPLGYDSIREEIMITDYEGFPSQLYSECMNFDNLYEYLSLDDDDKIKIAFILDQGEKFEYALGKYHDVYLNEDSKDSIYDLFEMYYPEAVKAEENNPYLTIDYDRFIKENFTRFEHEGIDYLIEDNWNN